ncbi:hypothetical protein ACFU7Y_38745 [Kitasatospora sp. NPDC057542]|nr:hypothetical protein [Streptomyces sp. LS1784]
MSEILALQGLESDTAPSALASSFLSTQSHDWVDGPVEAEK